MTLQNQEIAVLRDLIREIVREELQQQKEQQEAVVENEMVRDEEFEAVAAGIFKRYKKVLDALA